LDRALSFSLFQDGVQETKARTPGVFGRSGLSFLTSFFGTACETACGNLDRGARASELGDIKVHLRYVYTLQSSFAYMYIVFSYLSIYRASCHLDFTIRGLEMPCMA
jgi:hypothetical protein